jgi:DNA segregation ATPase FtsK/SpoIIIE-like protein
VHRVVEYLRRQGEPDYIEGILEGGTPDGEGEPGGAAASAAGGAESDAMYDSAVAQIKLNEAQLKQAVADNADACAAVSRFTTCAITLSATP